MPKKYAIQYNDSMSETINNSLNDPTHEKNVSLMETKKYKLETKKYQHFFCENCNYSTTILRDYEKHNNTKKHLLKVVDDDRNNSNNCECGKLFANRSGLWKHKKLCINVEQINKNKELTPEPIHKPTTEFTPDLFMEVLRQSKDLQNVLIEQNKELQNKLLQQNEEHNKQILELSKNQQLLGLKFMVTLLQQCCRVPTAQLCYLCRKSRLALHM